MNSICVVQSASMWSTVHNISSVNVKLTKNMNVSISGTGNPTLTCVNGANVSIVSSQSESVSLIFEFRDLELENCGEHASGFVFSGLDSLTLSNCSLSKSSDLLLVNIPNNLHQRMCLS